MHYRDDVQVACRVEEAFAYVADFANVAEWDPGVAESRRTTGGPLERGAEFELVALFRGSRVPLRYVVTVYEENHRVVLEGEGAKALATDTITFEDAGSGTRITYEADLRMKGLYRLVEPFLGGTFERMGNDALAGLKSKLGRPA